VRARVSSFALSLSLTLSSVRVWEAFVPHQGHRLISLYLYLSLSHARSLSIAHAHLIKYLRWRYCVRVFVCLFVCVVATSQCVEQLTALGL